MSVPIEPWLKKKDKTKTKKIKSNSPAAKKKKRKQKNFSIKAPPTSSRKGSKTKTGFNSKSLKFEPGMQTLICLFVSLICLFILCSLVCYLAIGVLIFTTY